MDPGAHSYEVHMKPYIHNFTWNLFELNKNLMLLLLSFIWSSYELLANFKWNKIEFIHMKFTRSSYELRMEFRWTSHEFHMKWKKIYSYEFTCSNTNEVDMRLINSSHEIHIKFIWISNDLNFVWTSCELHKNYMTSAQEVSMYYTWIWFLTSLLCTSYEWASRSIVVSIYRHPVCNSEKTAIPLSKTVVKQSSTGTSSWMNRYLRIEMWDI